MENLQNIKYLIEPLIIIATILILFWRTFKFLTIVDDIKRFGQIRQGLLLRPRHWFHQLKERLYGGGTFLIAKKCKECDGKGGDCKHCFGYGRRHIPNYKHEHIFETFLHIVICLMIYFAFGRSEVSFWGALLYAVNPTNMQTSVWLNGRRYAFNIIIVLAMVWLGPWGLLLYPFTALFQISALFAPIIYFNNIQPIYLLIGATVVGIYTWLSWNEIKEKILWRLQIMSESDQKTIHIRKLIPATKIYGKYFFQMLLPRQTLMVYPFMFYWGLTKEGDKKAYAFDKNMLVGLLAVVLSLAGLKFFEGQSFWLFLFMCLSIFMWSGFISFNQIFTDRYVSLPNVFMMFFLSWFVCHYGGNFKYLIFAIILTYYIIKLNLTMRMFRSVDDFWEYHFYFDRGNPNILEFKIKYCLLNKDVLGAWELVREGLTLNPKDMKFNMMAATCMRNFDDPSFLYYLGMSKKHCYTNQIDMYKGFEKDILGFDLDEEYSKIINKESKLTPQQREAVKDMFKVVNDPQSAKDVPKNI